MTWTLIDTPSPEELAWGFTPVSRIDAISGSEEPRAEPREIRHFFVTLFVIFALVVGVQGLFEDHLADGLIQERYASINGSADPKLADYLHDPDYRAVPERALSITRAGFDWNFPQHIPQRYALEELSGQVIKL